MENKNVTSESLIVGKRYWLDPVKDVSGIYIGINKRGSYTFSDIEGNTNWYLCNNDGSVSFTNPHDFFLVEEETKQQ